MQIIFDAVQAGDFQKLSTILSTPQLLTYALMCVGETQLTSEYALDMAHALLWHPLAHGHYYNELFMKIIDGNFHGRLTYSYSLYILWHDKYNNVKKPLADYKALPRLKKIAIEPVEFNQANWFNPQVYKSDLVPF